MHKTITRLSQTILTRTEYESPPYIHCSHLFSNVIIGLKQWDYPTKDLNLKNIIYVQGCVTTYFYVPAVYACDYGGRRVSNPMEIELQEVINHMMWVPEINLGPLEEQ